MACIKLINQLELDNLSEEQVDELLGELTASVTHLNTQSKNIKEDSLADQIQIFRVYPQTPLKFVDLIIVPIYYL
ncbi:MAG: hypothetical protein ACE5GU_12365 [Candidatus Scalinduaceae bacterium]